jgi:hypothetical protein
LVCLPLKRSPTTSSSTTWWPLESSGSWVDAHPTVLSTRRSGSAIRANHKGIVLLERQRGAKIRACFLDIREGLLGRVDRTVIKTGLKAMSAARWEREQPAGPGLLQKNVGAPSRRGTIKFEFDLDILGSLGQCSESL